MRLKGSVLNCKGRREWKSEWVGGVETEQRRDGHVRNKWRRTISSKSRRGRVTLGVTIQGIYPCIRDGGGLVGGRKLSVERN